MSTRNQWWNLPPLVMRKASADGHKIMKLDQLDWPCGGLQGAALSKSHPAGKLLASSLHRSVVSSDDSVCQGNSKCQWGCPLSPILLHLLLLCVCKNTCIPSFIEVE